MQKIFKKLFEKCEPTKVCLMVMILWTHKKNCENHASFDEVRLVWEKLSKSVFLHFLVKTQWSAHSLPRPLPPSSHLPPSFPPSPCVWAVFWAYNLLADSLWKSNCNFLILWHCHFKFIFKIKIHTLTRCIILLLLSLCPIYNHLINVIYK